MRVLTQTIAVKRKNIHDLFVIQLKLQELQDSQISCKYCQQIIKNNKMTTDDPRLNLLITQNPQSDIIIVGCPYDLLRKRSIGKGGEDNGPCCLRRFYPKVGPLYNPEFGINIGDLKVGDIGNINIEVSKEQEEQKFKNVASKRFKGQFVNYYKECPQKIIQQISDKLGALLKNKQFPFVFGGSKQALVANVEAFHQALPETTHKNVYILSAKALLDRPFDGNKYTSQNVCTLLHEKHPQTNFHIFGYHKKYTSSQFLGLIDRNTEKQQQQGKINFTSYEEIAATKLSKQNIAFGRRTKGLHKFMQIFQKNKLCQVNISVDVLELFMGCRDVEVQGLTFQELVQIMMFLGTRPEVLSICVCEFNPSCEDYESSIFILNAFYYFLMGRAKLIEETKCI